MVEGQQGQFRIVSDLAHQILGIMENSWKVKLRLSKYFPLQEFSMLSWNNELNQLVNYHEKCFDYDGFVLQCLDHLGDH
jgi:hypothetical protein